MPLALKGLPSARFVPVGVTGGGVVPPVGAPNTWNSATWAPGAPELELKES